MLPLRAERSFPYAGRTVQAGESFEPQSAHDAIVLKLGGLAVDAPTLAIEFESPIADKPKRTYRRHPVEDPRDAD